ncbi:MAG: helix-turn-helix transcriptional regulator [Acetobacteraceae bacterium]|nr:helix-turn-helix transcriptional regulator [Acetobacteraceae bacterium]
MLDDLLVRLRLEFDAFATCLVGNGWRLSCPPVDRVGLHYVLDGEGAVQIGDWPPVALGPHSIVVLPAHVTYVFSSGPDCGREVQARLSEAPLGALVPVEIAGHPPAGLTIACGLVRATYEEKLDLFARLDMPLIATIGQGLGLETQLRALLNEAATPRPGTRALIEALLKMCLVHLLRERLPSEGWPPSWLPMVRDRRLAVALEAMTEQPERPYTLEELARIAGMSRSSFASAFGKAFGRSPMLTLRELRLSRARDLILTRDLPVDAAARAVGLRSRSHFSRLFKRRFGVDPATFRARLRGT